MDILAFWFQIGSARIKWNNAISKLVPLAAGVKQGGILSPLLFSAFIDVVLTELSNFKAGCFLNGRCLNSFLYADDLLLLSLSISDLQLLINKCCVILENLDLQINLDKSSCLRFGPRFKINSHPITVDDKFINWVKEANYLGITLLAGINFRCDWHLAKRKFFTAINSILGALGSNPSIAVVLSLFQSICVPILCYGLNAMQLSKGELSSFSFAYDNIFHKLFKINDKKTIWLCQFFSNVWPFGLFYDFIRFNFLLALFSKGLSGADDPLTKSDWLEMVEIAKKYNFGVSDSIFTLKDKVRSFLDLSLSVDV